MRAIVPTQITTVEDKLVGGLTVRQFMLLAVPVALFILLLVLLPPRADIVAYKVVISTLVAFVAMPLAIKIKGKLLLDWLIVIMRYMARPRYYVYDKNTSYLRAMPKESQKAKIEKKKIIRAHDLFAAKTLPAKERLRLQSLIDQGMSVSVEVSKKGELHVIVTEKK